MTIDHLIAPYKLQRPVLTGSGLDGAFDSRAVDVPFVFFHNGRWHMTYVGFDGTGYQTALAVSDDLVHWEPQGVVLPRGSARGWDSVGMACTWILRDDDLYGPQTLKKIDGKYWMFYHAYPRPGYEAGGAEIGLAWTEDEALRDWHFHGPPVFSWRDGNAWDRGGLYKSCVIERDGTFYMFYNAKNVDLEDDGPVGWREQTGLATSTDMIHWTRFGEAPVLPVTPGAWDSVFASDPWVTWDSREKQWVMFYYGFNGIQAMDGVAVSRDLRHWEKFPAPILTTGAGGDLDSKYAHKPAVAWLDGALYHFYCACRPARPEDRARNGGEFRCLSVARSTPWANE